MKTAKEMFEAFGYRQAVNNEKAIVYGRHTKEYSYSIYFYLKAKVIYCEFDMSMKELKAINKQCEELGWFNEN